MISISKIFVYPIKSLGGFSVNTAQLTSRGLQYDRRWLLIDENNVGLTQREFAKMAILQTVLLENGIEVFNKHNTALKSFVPFNFTASETITVKIWDGFCLAQVVSEELNNWFSTQLNTNCKLVYMPDNSLRKVDANFAVSEDNITSFSDGYPILLASQQSLDVLNNKLETPLDFDRFRPNIVVDGLNAYEEDEITEFEINSQKFYGVKPCSRCVVTTINQQTTEKGKEPLKTLATYRSINNKIKFGQNVIGPKSGSIKIGDSVHVLKKNNI